MSSQAKNLRRIDEALEQHNSRCEFPVIEIRMNPFEVERLGWDDYKGIPIVADDKLGTGRFRLVCERDLAEPKKVEVEQVKPVPVGA